LESGKRKREACLAFARTDSLENKPKSIEIPTCLPVLYQLDLVSAQQALDFKIPHSAEIAALFRPCIAFPC